MKKTRLLFLGLIFLSFVTACGPSQEEAVAYNDNIIKQQRLIVEKLDALMASYENYIAAEMDAAYNALNKQIDDAIATVTQMDALGNNSEFKESAIALFKTYQEITLNEHKEMVRIYKIPEDDFKDEHRLKWDELYKASEEKIQKATTKFLEIQQQFAKSYNLEVEVPVNE